MDACIIIFIIIIIFFTDPVELQLKIENTIRSRDEDSGLSYLDRLMSNELNTKTSSGVIDKLLSDGLVKPSVKNCISLMTTSGAKGSKVSFCHSGSAW